MIVPLFLGAIINTLFPEVLEIGSFTTALFKDGAVVLIALFFVCMGSQIQFKSAVTALEKGTAMLIGKYTAALFVGLAIAFLTPDGSFMGLAPLAVIAAMSNSNGALYVALTGEFGNKTDKGAVSVLSLNDGPFLTLIALGTGIDFQVIFTSGAPGLVLGLFTIILSGSMAMLSLYLWHVLRRHPKPTCNVVGGACEATTAGNAIATPVAVAAADPSYAPILDVATTQVAASVGVSPQNTPATKIWFGEVRNAPGHRSLPHHHAECETGGRVITGPGHIYFGEDYAEYVDMKEGDWVFVPPFVPHVEANLSTTEELVWMTARTPENLVINLPDVEDGTLAGYRRA